MPKITVEPVIFDAALRLVVAHGFRSTTMAMIADAAGVNQATLFRRYATKTGLFARALDATLATHDIAEVRYTGALQADMAAILKAQVQPMAAHGPLVPVMLVEVMRDPELGSLAAGFFRTLAASEAVIRRYQDEGLLEPGPTNRVLNALAAPLVAELLLAHVAGGAERPEFDFDRSVAMFLTGYGRQKARPRARPTRPS